MDPYLLLTDPDPTPDPTPFFSKKKFLHNFLSVGDTDPEPDLQDTHVFGPLGSGPISLRYGSGSGSFPFRINVFSGLK